MDCECRWTEEETWDAIAESFSSTRRTPWKQCLVFIDILKNSDIVADVGCGNGRHLIPSAQHCRYAIGVDISRNLLNIIQNTRREKGLQNVLLIHANAVHLPLQDKSVNALLCIASLHNIQGRTRRLQALHEMNRVLSDTGTALISVWSRWQRKHWRFFVKQYFFRSGEYGDISIYWRQHHLNVPRFYHLYSKKEFVQELKKAGFIVKDFQRVKLHSKRFPDNYFAIVQKR